MIGAFKTTQQCKDVDRHTKTTYDNGTKIVADYVLTDGTRVGSKRVADFSQAFADAIFAKLIEVKDVDVDGNVSIRQRRPAAIAAMGACRRVWFVMKRAEKALVPAINPSPR
jgi:hypothetical protein